jgi:pyrimidine-nucleoside phosphorylase
MNTPIGATVGNALELKEAVAVMQGNGPQDTIELTVELGAHMLLLGKKAGSLADGRVLIKNVLANGQALDLFAQVIERQHGDSRICSNPDLLPKAEYQTQITAQTSGYVAAIEPRDVAMAALAVKAGRVKKEDSVDPATGVELLVSKGSPVKQGTVLALLHHNGTGHSDAEHLLNRSFILSDIPPDLSADSLIKKRFV